LLAFLALAAPAARATSYGDIEVVVFSDPKGDSGHGYFEYALVVTNHSKERSHTVGLVLPHERFARGGDSIRELRRTVQVGAGETVRVSLLQPDHPPLGGSDLSVILDDRRQEHEVPLRPNQTRRNRYGFYSRGYFGSAPGGSELLVLMSGGIHKQFPQPAAPGGRMAPPVGSGAMVPAPPGGPTPWMLATAPPAVAGIPLGTQFVPAGPVESWSANWLGYSRYDGIVVTADDLKAMAPAVRTALWQYVETGGSLLVLGPADLNDLSGWAKEQKNGWQTIACGFGRCIVSPDDNLDKWDEAHLTALGGSWVQTSSPWQGRRNSFEANQKFPVVEDIGIPVRGLFVLMVLFVLAIGPINLMVLARKKRRIWMLWTTPVISLVTCLAVLGYMLVSEGWQGHLRTETLTLLDPASRRATTIGWTGFYSPLTPGDGLHFSYETEVVPQRRNEGRRAGIRSCALDWSQDQHFTSGWVEARVPAHFQVRKSEVRRERVTLHREPDGRLSIVNGLGAEVRRFWYADEKGQLYTAEQVAPGARAILTMENKEAPPAQAQTLRAIFVNENWVSAIQGMTLNTQRLLRPRSYLAELDDSPFLEDALRYAKTRKCHALVLGTLREGDERD
jgi:hypothetical protein